MREEQKKKCLENSDKKNSYKKQEREVCGFSASICKEEEAGIPSSGDSGLGKKIQHEEQQRLGARKHLSADLENLTATVVNIVLGSLVWVEDDIAWIDGKVVRVNGDEIKIICTNEKKGDDVGISGEKKLGTPYWVKW